jgi:hypothetical protein
VKNPLSKAICVFSLAGVINPAIRAEDSNLPSQPVPVVPASAEDASASHTPVKAANQSTLLPTANAVDNAARPAPATPSLLQSPAAAGDICAQPVPATRGVCIYEPIGLWLDASYLLWWTKDNRVPPLVSRGVPPGSNAIGPAQPTLLLPGSDGDWGARSGGKFDLGFWFCDNQKLGLEAGYFFLGTNRSTLATGLEASATADPSVPPAPDPPGHNPDPDDHGNDHDNDGVHDHDHDHGHGHDNGHGHAHGHGHGHDDDDDPAPASGVSSPPDPPPGSFAITRSSFLQSADVNLLSNVCCACCYRIDVLAGFRYLELDEKLQVTQNFMSTDGAEDDVWNDEWHTRNQFYGGQLGGRARFCRESFFADVGAGVALGVTHEQVDISGGLTQTTFSPGVDAFGNPIVVAQVSRTNGGLLSQPGSSSRDRFAVVPEVNVDAGYEFNRFCRASVGYNFMYWSSVARPGNQVGGVPRATDFWAQGLTFTLGLLF